MEYIFFYSKFFMYRIESKIKFNFLIYFVFNYCNNFTNSVRIVVLCNICIYIK